MKVLHNVDQYEFLIYLTFPLYFIAEYDCKKIIEYPGFNVPVPKGIRDVSDSSLEQYCEFIAEKVYI